jgi:hypothetical protein
MGLRCVGLSGTDKMIYTVGIYIGVGHFDTMVRMEF